MFAFTCWRSCCRWDAISSTCDCESSLASRYFWSWSSGVLVAMSMSIGMVGLHPNMTLKGEKRVDSCTDVLHAYTQVSE